MTRLRTTLLSLFLVLSVIACKKDDVVAVKTKTDIITGTTWQVQSASASGGLAVVYSRDLANNGYDLSKVRLTFKADGTASAIDNNGNSSSSGSWKFTNNEGSIELSNISFGGFSSGTLTIIQLTEKNFDFSSKASFPALGISDIEATIKMTPAQ
jgi:hypothetical protein